MRGENNKVENMLVFEELLSKYKQYVWNEISMIFFNFVLQKKQLFFSKEWIRSK